MCVFFFFKQKTAYEMRISDWSSDVCSSDLFPRSQQIEIKEVILRNDLLAARVIANHEFDRVRSLIQRKVSKIISAAIEIELLENETVYAHLNSRRALEIEGCLPIWPEHARWLKPVKRSEESREGKEGISTGKA